MMPSSRPAPEDRGGHAESDGDDRREDRRPGEELAEARVVVRGDGDGEAVEDRRDDEREDREPAEQSPRPGYDRALGARIGRVEHALGLEPLEVGPARGAPQTGVGMSTGSPRITGETAVSVRGASALPASASRSTGTP